jgi:hypothetical protein
VAARYERLRLAALAPHAEFVAGFGVVIGRGVSAWVHTSLVACPGPRLGPASPGPCLPGEGLHADLVRVWAQMALAVHRKEVTSWTSVAPDPRR